MIRLAIVLALLAPACVSVDGEGPSLSDELALVTADVRDAVHFIDDPELQDEITELVASLDEVAALVASAEAGAARPLSEQLLALSTELLAIPGLPDEAKIALVAARVVLRRL